MKFRRKTLDSCLTVLFEGRDVGVTTMMLAVRYGSGDDGIEQKGMAHFIEHLCFKGTRKRTAKEIMSELEGFGGELNAGTHEDFTVYYVKFPSEHLGKAMEVLFDVFFCPIFPKKEVERERSVILEEIKMYHDAPHARVLDKISEGLYAAPFGCSGLGRKEDVARFSGEELKGRHSAIYVPSNVILSVVGNNDFDEVVRLAERFVDDARRNVDMGEKVIGVDRPEIVKRHLKDSEKREGLHQANIALGLHFPTARDNDRYAAELFCSILGEGMSSRLFEEVREKRGLVYGVKSNVDMGPDHGSMIIWAGTSPDSVEEVREVCLEEVGKMGSLTQEELDSAKVRIKGFKKVESENCGHVALDLVSEEISGKAEEYYEFEGRVDAVKLEDVRKLARFEDYAWYVLSS